MSDEALETLLKRGKYTTESIKNIFLIRKKLFRDNNHFIIVPTEDDICRRCNKLKDKAPECIEPEWDFEIKELSSLGVSVCIGKTYTPHNIAKGIMQSLEEISDIPKYKQLLEFYKINYERLRGVSQ